MNHVSLTTTAGKFYWGSLFGYCIAFSGFFFLTQYTQNRIEIEEKSGVFAAFKEDACHHEPYCSEVILTNEFDPVQKKLITKLDVPYKQKKSIDQARLQQDYTTLIVSLPWFMQRQFGNTIEIRPIFVAPPKKKNSHA